MMVLTPARLRLADATEAMFAPDPGLLRFRSAARTVISAAITLTAMLVSMFVLPFHQTWAFRAATAAFLDALAGALKAAVGACTDQALNGLREATQALRHSLGGPKRGWVPLVPDAYRQAGRAAMRCAYLAREMAERQPRPAAEIEELVKTIARVRQSLVGDAAGRGDSCWHAGE